MEINYEQEIINDLAKRVLKGEKKFPEKYRHLNASDLMTKVSMKLDELAYDREKKNIYIE